MKDLKTILEASVLGDIEDTLASMDKYDAVIKKAEKDWKKLLNTPFRNIRHHASDLYFVKIKSEELAWYLGRGHKAYEDFKDTADNVGLIIRTSDVLFNSDGFVNIEIRNYGGYPVLLQAAIEYCTAEESKKYFKDIETNSDGSIPLKYACEAIFEAIRKSKLTDLEYVKQEFDKHITYERK
jgi:hypothetical protein